MKTIIILFSLIFTTSLMAQNTYVPDDNFEQALIDLGYDSGALDDYVPTANINTLTSLDVHNKNISDLTGIEDFTALTNLDCHANNLTSLDVSNNTALTSFDCSSNNLSSLDISNNTALTLLRCTQNNLTSLDVSNNTALLKIYCYYNNLSSLDISTNINLTGLHVNHNNLSSLNVANNTLLIALNCGYNNLTDLDVSANIVLTYFICKNNALSSLNLKNGNNTAIPNNLFNATNNPNITCIEVDDAAWSTTNWTNIDPTASFSEDCNLSAEEYDLLNAFNVYPNPANDVINITNNSEEPITSIQLFNILGERIYFSDKFQKTINISKLDAGLYLLEIRSKAGNITKKIIISD